MDKIKSYIDRFFKEKKENKNYSITTNDMIALMNKLQSVDANGLFYVIISLFKYGYAKGYRACKAEQKKGGATSCRG